MFSDVPPDLVKVIAVALIVESAVTVISVSIFQEPQAEVVPPQAKVPPANTMLPA